MNKSLEYIKKRISSPGTRFSDRNMSNAYVIPLKQFMKFDESNLKVCKYIFQENSHEFAFLANFIYGSNADYEYFTSKVCIHDGTLLFVNETIRNCIDNILYVKTYNITKGFPKELNGAEFTYTIGDIVVVNEYDEYDSKFAPPEKPWLQERTTVMIPLIYSYKENVTSTFHNGF